MEQVRRAQRRRSDLVSILTQCYSLKSRSFERCPKIIVGSSSKIGWKSWNHSLSEGVRKNAAGFSSRDGKAQPSPQILMKLDGVFITLPCAQRGAPLVVGWVWGVGGEHAPSGRFLTYCAWLYLCDRLKQWTGGGGELRGDLSAHRICHANY